MSIVKNKDKRTGITYVYESESYWDKEKQQPRARRKLIGKIDEQTGEIVPTDGRGRKRKDRNTTLAGKDTQDDHRKQLAEKDLLIEQLRAENRALKKERESFLKDLHLLLSRYGTQNE